MVLEAEETSILCLAGTNIAGKALENPALVVVRETSDTTRDPCTFRSIQPCVSTLCQAMPPTAVRRYRHHQR
jgi:hypothetical protein